MKTKKQCGVGFGFEHSRKVPFASTGGQFIEHATEAAPAAIDPAEIATNVIG